MGKKLVVIAMLVFLAFPSSFAQAADTPVSPFSSVQGMAGLILEATGYGLVIGGGAASSLDLQVSVALMQIAPIASSCGAWLTQGFMVKTNEFWVNEGVAFDGSGYIKKSLTCAIVTTAFGAGALLAPAFDQDLAGTIVSIVFAGVSVCTDIYGLYGPRLGWTKALNAAILESGVDWKAAKAR